MFEIDERSVIHVTRGDVGAIVISAPISEYTNHTFKAGDVLRLKVFEKNRCDNIVLKKDVSVDEDTEFVDMFLSRHDTKIGSLISKPVDYWYEVELNPETAPQTIIGYDKSGPKVLRLYPEGDDNV